MYLYIYILESLSESMIFFSLAKSGNFFVVNIVSKLLKWFALPEMFLEM